ncbi:hypothetical protein OHS81_16820 [Streptomyces sp. NBC_00400]|uniref:hypothetical protein n=1 Tax=Streptomyces sp. NBC_00400 TaxID=2975737 RepID=UPI002E1F4EDA
MFNETEVSEIGEASVTLGATRRDPIDLAIAWENGVKKINSDRSLPSSDRSVWSEHDLAGTLFLRDHLERALQKLRPSLREKMERYVAEADGLFRSYTVDDPEHRMLRVAEVDAQGRKWWWSRVPDSGPIAEDLSRY